MSATNLLEVARQRRIRALASLKEREDNLFFIADHLMARQDRRNRPTPVFATLRKKQPALQLVSDMERKAA